MELSNLGIIELRELEKQISIEIKRRDSEEMLQARQQILAIAQRVGIPLKDLISEDAKKAKKPVSALSGKKIAVRFRHPRNATLTWSGRGIRPKWITAWIDAGGTIDQLRVST